MNLVVVVRFSFFYIDRFCVSCQDFFSALIINFFSCDWNWNEPTNQYSRNWL